MTILNSNVLKQLEKLISAPIPYDLHSAVEAICFGVYAMPIAEGQGYYTYLLNKYSGKV